jgi:predicted nuclease of predicted toxin-antitoxin system
MYDLVADEDIPKPVVEKLRDTYKIFYIAEEQKGSTDREVLEKSRELEIPILTFDNDFFKYDSHPGIMHITQRTNYSIIAKAVKDIREKTEKEEVEDSVLRVNPSLYRD